MIHETGNGPNGIQAQWTPGTGLVQIHIQYGERNQAHVALTPDAVMRLVAVLARHAVDARQVQRAAQEVRASRK